MPHIDKIFADLNPHHADDALVRDLLLSCIVDGVFIPAALDHCAAILRDMSGCHADVAVAAAQATLSARILTYLPVGAVALILFVSASFRASLFTMPVLVPLALGIILNRIGWKWILRSISHTLLNRSTEVATLTDSLCVSLRSGRTMTQACEQWHGQTPAGTEVATFLRHGHSLENSLSPLSNSLGTHGTNLADIIRQAHQDGLPVVATVAQLSTDARHERRRAADILIRQLPTKLSIPLVLCVLPSFLLMAVAPIAISHLAQLTATPSLLSPT
jgi:tight adherence protein B